MTSVWKRLQRYNKRAGKFKFTIAYHELELECDHCVKALPKKLRVIWTRRGRRLESTVQSWQPTLTNPLKGTASWPTTEIQEITVTLFRDPRSDAYDDKDWKILVEEASGEDDVKKIRGLSSKHRPLASADVNVNKYVTGAMSQQEELLELKPLTKKVKSCRVSLTVSSLFLKEGQATDDDMMSLASMMSSVPSDIARLEDVLDEEEATVFVASPSPSPASEISSLTARVNELVMDLHSDHIERSVDEPSASTSVEKEPEKAHRLDKGDRSALKPLELKPVVGRNPSSAKSNDNINNNNISRPASRVLERSNTLETPSQDLQTWAQDVTRGYRGVRLTNMTTSWRNGMAFCAVFHKFRPDLIDFDSLVPTDIKTNCRLAFEAGEKLGIPRVIEPADMVFLAVPDKLAVMTYLHQVKAHFTGEELRVKSVVDKSAKFELERSNSTAVTATAPNRPSAPAPSSVVLGLGPRLQASIAGDDAERVGTELPPPQRGVVASPDAGMEEKGFSKFSAKLFNMKRWKRSSPASAAVLTSPGSAATSAATSGVGEAASPSDIRISTSREALAFRGDSSTGDKNRRTPAEANGFVPQPELDSSPTSPSTNTTPPVRSQTAPNGFASPSSLPSTPVRKDGTLPDEKPKTRGEQLRERARRLMDEAKRSPSVDRLSSPSRNPGVRPLAGFSSDRPPSSSPSPFVRDVRGAAEARAKSAGPSVGSVVGSGMKRSPGEKILNPRASLRRYKKKHPSVSVPEPETEVREAVAAVDLSPTRNGVGATTEAREGDDGRGARNPLIGVDSANLNAADVKPVQPVKLSSFDPSGARTEAPPAIVIRRPPSLFSAANPDDLVAGGGGVGGQRKSVYIQREQRAIELEQAKIDVQASKLEEKVRAAMRRGEDQGTEDGGGGGGATEEEEELLLKWFKLVNEKSALLRRQMQLNVMEKEEDLERRVELLTNELREMFGADESRKTDVEREREQLLLDELVELVNERDLLVRQMDEENERMDEEREIARDVVTRASFRTGGRQPLLPATTTTTTTSSFSSSFGGGGYGSATMPRFRGNPGTGHGWSQQLEPEPRRQTTTTQDDRNCVVQ